MTSLKYKNIFITTKVIKLQINYKLLIINYKLINPGSVSYVDFLDSSIEVFI